MVEEIRFESSGLFGRPEDAVAAALQAITELGLRVTLERRGDFKVVVSTEEVMPLLISQVSLSPFEIIVGQCFGLLLQRRVVPATPHAS